MSDNPLRVKSSETDVLVAYRSARAVARALASLSTVTLYETACETESGGLEESNPDGGAKSNRRRENVNASLEEDDVEEDASGRGAMETEMLTSAGSTPSFAAIAAAAAEISLSSHSV
jgi:hypothetical protein